MNYKRIIPDGFTSLNLLCGAVATYMATQGEFEWAFLFILGGAFFDFFDGWSARILKAPSPIGIQLDSLADDITFGLAPSMMLFCYVKPLVGWWAIIALFMAAFSALRLAKFNVDERQHDSFIGLATPANAIFWGGICTMPTLWLVSYPYIAWVLLALSLLSCYLLNAEIPFFSFKAFKRERKTIILFFIGCCICFVLSILLSYPLLAGTACIVWYVLLNVIKAIIHKP